MVAQVTEQCRTLTTDESKQIICMSGVYNSLANAYSSRSYALAYSPSNDADSICAEEPFEYQERCYIELTNGTVRNAGLSFERSIGRIRSLPAHARSNVLRAYLDDEIRHEMQEPSAEKAAAVCDYFSDPEEHIDCVSGALRAFVYMSAAGSEELATLLYSFCLLQEDVTVQTACAGKTRAHLASNLSADDIVRICTARMTYEQCVAPADSL